jgi:Asp-tRNA(Asn)/Glu-tRNA(Gln) amidotransferase A subunit family amidase
LTSLIQLSAVDAAKKIAQGELKPSQLLRATLDRIAEREPQVGAFEWVGIEEATAEAKRLDQTASQGLLHGLPIGVKDLIDTASAPATYGSPIYKGHRPAWDAPCVAQAKLQGAIVVGKTVTTEFAIFHPGKTANPHNLGHTPGGSSSGSAAAVADRMLPLAFGTQTAASIFRPASFCGVVGYKPTFNTINRFGAKQLSDTLDTIGVMANSVADAALFTAAAARRKDLVLSGVSANAPRVGICRTYEWEHAQAETKHAIESCASRLAAAGAKVVDITLPEDFKQLLAAQIDIMVAESSISLSYEYANHKDKLSQKLIDVIEAGQQVSEARYLQAIAIAERCRAQLDQVFAQVDILVAPSAKGEAPAGLGATGDPVFSRIWTLLGIPGLNLPWSRGPNRLPGGVVLLGRHQGDHHLLQAAQWVESIRGESHV